MSRNRNSAHTDKYLAVVFKEMLGDLEKIGERAEEQNRSLPPVEIVEAVKKAEDTINTPDEKNAIKHAKEQVYILVDYLFLAHTTGKTEGEMKKMLKMFKFFSHAAYILDYGQEDHRRKAIKLVNSMLKSISMLKSMRELDVATLLKQAGLLIPTSNDISQEKREAAQYIIQRIGDLCGDTGEKAQDELKKNLYGIMYNVIESNAGRSARKEEV